MNTFLRLATVVSEGRRKGGREEGRKGGREEGRKGGREEGRKGGREEGRKGGAYQHFTNPFFKCFPVIHIQLEILT